MGLNLITPAADRVVSVAAAKAHCGIEDSEFDAQIAAFLDAATTHAENVTGRAFGSQTWELVLDAFGPPIVLDRGPVTGVTWIRYLDESRVQQTLDSAVYITDLTSNPQRIVLDPDQSWPSTADLINAVTVRFVTGYATAPAPVVQAILMAVGTWFADREAGLFPQAAAALLHPYRKLVI